jgi:hypothetical protein
MQDLRDGSLKEIFGDIPIDEAGAKVGIPKQFQGPVFKIGEQIEIRGGQFKVHAFGKTHIVFESLPGTHLK